MEQIPCARCGKQMEWKQRLRYCADCRTIVNRENTLARRNAENAAKVKPPKFCNHCGVQFEHKNPAALYCGDVCRLKVHNIQSREDHRKRLGAGTKPVATKHTPKPGKHVDRDIEQRRINLEIDARYHIELAYQHYTPKHPDFMQIANIYLQREMSA